MKIWRISCTVTLAAFASLAWGATTMQAAVYQGGKLTLETRDIPQAGANEVRIKVRAAGVNPVDYVIATASPRNHEFLRAIGASEVIDYNAVRFEEQLKELDVVLNTVDVATGVRSLGVLKPDGILVSVVPQPGAEQCQAAKVRCARPDRGTGPSVAALLDKVGELVAAGQYRVNVDRTFALAQANEAWDLAKQKHTRGKLIITMPNQ